MEAGGISLKEWINERFKRYDSRLRDAESKMSDQEKAINAQDRSLVKIDAKLSEQGTDIEEMKQTLNRIMWGLFGAIAVGLMFVVAVVTLVVQAVH